MDFEEIQKILAMVREHELSEFELEHEGFKIRIRKDRENPVVHVPPVGAPMAPPPAPAAAPASDAPVESPAAEDGEVEFAVVKSPIVGTFYRSAEPAAHSFVEIGDIVKKGQALCIIEAMKLMNEIDSEYEGEVVKVYVENGQAVQYGERLFAIRAT